MGTQTQMWQLMDYSNAEVSRTPINT